MRIMIIACSILLATTAFCVSTATATVFAYTRDQDWILEPIKQLLTSTSRMPFSLAGFWMLTMIATFGLLPIAIRWTLWTKWPKWAKNVCRALSELAFLQAWLILWIEPETYAFVGFIFAVFIVFRWGTGPPIWGSGSARSGSSQSTQKGTHL